ncbi:hypothetical protein CLV42_102606 [Chitinophaga ginsengisoli]|uniref:Uncharacterized protein n=1 Tax=Chitinophaga ginsengisoli TaxID=363837 RepID=A0A2P8GM28_9BACT|nr:hypothetical protein CLV42_102606 [Chitinophaga ginsengisoli]
MVTQSLAAYRKMEVTSAPQRYTSAKVAGVKFKSRDH